MKKSVTACLLLLFSCVIFTVPIPTVAAEAGVERSGKTAGGKAASVVSLPASGVSPTLIIAAGRVTADASVDSFIQTAKANGGEPLAMVNGAYFNAYYDAGKTAAFPGNCAITASTLVKDGRMIHSGGTIAFAYTTNGKFLIDSVDMKVKIVMGEGIAHTAWGVNTYFEDPAAIMIFTPELGMGAPVSSGAVVYTVEGDLVINKQTGLSQVTAAEGQTVIVFGQAAYANASQWDNQPEIGSPITLENSFKPSRPDKEADWAAVTLSVGAGPLLLRDGADVSGDTELNKSFAGDSKHQGSAQRTFIGIKPDNGIVIVEAATTYADAAATLKARGCVDAMALDGGASSFLYAGGQTLQAPGRKLNNVIAFHAAQAQAPAETVPAPPKGPAAIPTASAVLVNGQPATFEAYSIEGSNYFKLRDLAYALSGTEKQFAVDWNAAQNAIMLTSGNPYTPDGSEMQIQGGGNKTPVSTRAAVYLNGGTVAFTAYSIDGNNYFKLRDMGAALDFEVAFDSASNTIRIDTGRPYAG